MGHRPLSFISLNKEGDRICFIVILAAAEKCLCGNKCCVITLSAFHWNNAFLHLQTEYKTCPNNIKLLYTPLACKVTIRGKNYIVIHLFVLI